MTAFARSPPHGTLSEESSIYWYRQSDVRSDDLIKVGLTHRVRYGNVTPTSLPRPTLLRRQQASITFLRTRMQNVAYAYERVIHLIVCFIITVALSKIARCQCVRNSAAPPLARSMSLQVRSSFHVVVNEVRVCYIVMRLGTAPSG